MLAIFNMLGGPEFIVILIVGLLLFGGRLPDVGKSVGKTLIEFRKGLRDLKKDIGLDEVSDLRSDLQKDLGQLTQAHYNLLDVPDEELEDRQESLGEEEAEAEKENTEEGFERETSHSKIQPLPSQEEAEREEAEREEEGEEGPFAREDEELGAPLPNSDSDGDSTPPPFGYSR